MKTPCRYAVRQLMLLLGACLIASLVMAQSLEIIDLKYRRADEVIPVLQPLVESGGALSGSDYKLFVRASADNVAQLRRALAQIDRPPRQLLVSVRRAARQTIEREAVAGSVVVGNRGAGATIHATDAAAQRQDGGIASVQVLEGNAAWIATGESVPYVTAVAAGQRRSWVAATTTFRDINSGFLVTPRVSGQSVTLDIEQQAQRRSPDNAATIQTQSLGT
ncbi:MAG TPA: secretin N-terminal domain-containing protein, partial [Povalibacter sp.]|nr:secretin N-terminal domain-containing protein [Povalibacter sp.]